LHYFYLFSRRYKNLFFVSPRDQKESQKEASHKNLTEIEEEEIKQKFIDSFPSEVLHSPKMMQALNDLGVRCATLRSTECGQKLLHIPNIALDCIKNHFLTTSVDSSLGEELRLKERKNELNYHVRNMEKNVEIRNHLIVLGYSPKLFKHDLEISVSVDDRKNLEENYKRDLCKSVYTQYIELLKLIYPDQKTIDINGTDLKLEKVFSDDFNQGLSLGDLKSRRNLV